MYILHILTTCFLQEFKYTKSYKRLEGVMWNRKSNATSQRLRFHWVILGLQSKGQSMYRRHQRIVLFLVFLVCTRSCTAQNSLNKKVCTQSIKYVVRVWKTSKKVWPEVLLKSLQQRLSWWGFKRMYVVLLVWWSLFLIIICWVDYRNLCLTASNKWRPISSCCCCY